MLAMRGDRFAVFRCRLAIRLPARVVGVPASEKRCLDVASHPSGLPA